VADPDLVAELLSPAFLEMSSRGGLSMVYLMFRSLKAFSLSKLILPDSRKSFDIEMSRKYISRLNICICSLAILS